MSSASRVRVALVYDRIYPPLKGGGERRFYEIGRRLASGFEVAFFHYYQYPRAAYGPAVPHYTPVGVGGRVPMYTRRGRRSLRQGLDFAARLARPLTDFRPDIIDCSSVSYPSIPVCAAVAAARQAALVITWHEFWDHYWARYLPPALATCARAFERQMPRLATANVAVSGFTATRLRQATGRRADVIANGVDTAGITRADPSPTSTDVLFVGRLIKEKRLDLLLDAAALVASSGRSALHVTIVGQGPEETAVRRRIASLPKNVSVELLPAIPSELELYGRMKSATMLVLPSEREGYGLVVAEAQAAGTVPIVIRAPDSAAVELVEQGRTGFIADPSPAELGRAMRRLLEDALLRRSMAQAALAISTTRDWATAAQATARVFERVRRAPCRSTGEGVWVSESGGW